MGSRFRCSCPLTHKVHARRTSTQPTSRNPQSAFHIPSLPLAWPPPTTTVSANGHSSWATRRIFCCFQTAHDIISSGSQQTRRTYVRIGLQSPDPDICWHIPSGIWHLASSIWHLAFGIWRLKLCPSVSLQRRRRDFRGTGVTGRRIKLPPASSGLRLPSSPSQHVPESERFPRAATTHAPCRHRDAPTKTRGLNYLNNCLPCST